MANKNPSRVPEKNIELNGLCLAYLVDEIRPKIEGGFINKIQNIDQRLTKIKVHTNDGSNDLIVGPTALFIGQHSFPALQQGSKQHFIESVKKIIYNKRILSMKQHSFDKVVVLELPQHNLIIELFGAGNLVLTDKEFAIVAVKKTENLKDRILKKGHKYVFPAGRGLSPLELDESLRPLMADSGTEASKALVKTVDISPSMAEEALFQIGIDRAKPAEKLSRQEVLKIASKVKELFTASREKYKPVKAGASLLPFRLSSTPGDWTEISSLNNELDDFYSKSVIAADLGVRSESASKEKDRAEHTYRQIVAAKEKMEKQADVNKQKGEALYANFQEVQRIIDAVKKAIEKKVPEKEIVEKINSVLERNLASKIRLKKVDLKTKQMVVELKE
jgi:predicted ribosome quality control (RQC) complex YloA/Tae2 family protein